MLCCVCGAALLVRLLHRHHSPRPARPHNPQNSINPTFKKPPTTNPPPTHHHQPTTTNHHSEVAKLKEETWRSQEDHVEALWARAVERNDRPWIILACFLFSVAIGLLTVVAWRINHLL